MTAIAMKLLVKTPEVMNQPIGYRRASGRPTAAECFGGVATLEQHRKQSEIVPHESGAANRRRCAAYLGD
jgi:hypothetical protein